jgi:hypothetical protein
LELRDVGDVDVPSLEPQLARHRIGSAARQLRSKVRLPGVIERDKYRICIA